MGVGNIVDTVLQELEGVEITKTRSTTQCAELSIVLEVQPTDGVGAW